MNQNSVAITVLCSYLCVGENIKPLEPKEWSELAKQMMERGIQPSELLDYSPDDFREKFVFNNDMVERVLRLIKRSASLSFEISKFENMGIHIVTRADADYPKKLKKALGNGCPPLFYYAGDLKLLETNSVGYVGSRTAEEKDIAFTIEAVRKTITQCFSVVSGGAKGIDQTAETEALRLGGTAIAFLSDSMLKKIKSPTTIQAIQQGRLLLFSAVKPDAGFNAGVAMMRNRYIYAQSSGTVVVKSDYNKGGTWNGAIENLRHEWCSTFCWNNKEYAGNMALIQKGAIPIDETWDGNVTLQKPQQAQQLSFFDSDKI